jgi:hypothetical protein
MPTPTRQFLQRIAGGFVVDYVVIVATLAVLKVRPGADEPPLGLRGSWAEVFYGPAIAVCSVFLLLVIAAWLECQMGQKS